MRENRKGKRKKQACRETRSIFTLPIIHARILHQCSRIRNQGDGPENRNTPTKLEWIVLISQILVGFWVSNTDAYLKHLRKNLGPLCQHYWLVKKRRNFELDKFIINISTSAITGRTCLKTKLQVKCTTPSRVDAPTRLQENLVIYKPAQRQQVHYLSRNKLCQNMMRFSPSLTPYGFTRAQELVTQYSMREEVSI